MLNHECSCFPLAVAIASLAVFSPMVHQHRLIAALSLPRTNCLQIPGLSANNPSAIFPLPTAETILLASYKEQRE